MTLWLQIGAALGGLSFLGTLIGALAMWRKTKAEAKKIGVDAATVLTDTALKAATEAIEHVEQQAAKLGAQLERTQGELELTRDKLHAVLRHMRVLEDLLRASGVSVPDFVYPPRNGVA